MTKSYFHGTFENVKGNFFPFTHFGTRTAALELLGLRYVVDGVRGTPMLYEAKLIFQKPIKVPDFHSPEPKTWPNKLLENKSITETEFQMIRNELKKAPSEYDQRPVRLAIMANFFSQINRDCLEYVNQHEDIGSTSYAPVSGQQINVISVSNLSLQDIENAWNLCPKAITYPWP